MSKKSKIFSEPIPGSNVHPDQDIDPTIYPRECQPDADENQHDLKFSSWHFFFDICPFILPQTGRNTNHENEI